MSLGMQFVTIGVPNVSDAMALFVDEMKFQIEAEYAVGERLRDAWGLQDKASLQVAELSCQGYPIGRIRLLEVPGDEGRFVRDDHGAGAPDTPLDIGAKAIDFYVANPISAAVSKLNHLGLETRSQPVRYRIDALETEEVLLTGPGRIPMLLMVGHAHPAKSMRQQILNAPFSEVATVSVVCGNPEASRRFYENVLGLELRTRAWVPEQYTDLVCQLTGAPAGTRMLFQLFGAKNEPSGKVLLVHFEDTNAKRLANRMKPGNLGFCMMTFAYESLDDITTKAQSAPFEIENGPMRAVGNQRTMLIRGPNEECVECIETG